MSSASLELCQQDHQATPSSTLLVAATGTGKSTMMSGLVARWPVGRVMVISHLYEINRQLMDTLEGFCSEPVDLEQAQYTADQCTLANRARIVVASVQTLNSKKRNGYRFEKFLPSDFGLIFIDEAHHATSASYRRVINHFRQNEACKIVGCTATPDRTDGVGLGHIFESVACNYDIKWAMDNGWLVPVKQRYVQINDLDFSGLKTNRSGDFRDSDIAQIMETEGHLHEVAMPFLAEAGDRQGICFTASVAQAHGIKEVLNRHRPGAAEAIDGSLPPMHPDRKRIIHRFKTGELQFLCNCAALTEGFDAPSAIVCAMARPTKSRSLYTQCVGRVLRPYGVDLNTGDRLETIKASAKPYAVVLDYVGNAGQHSLICTGDILAGEEPPEVIERARNLASSFDGDMVEAIEEAKKELEREAEEKRKRIKAEVKYETKEIDAWTPMDVVPPRTVRGFDGNRLPSPKMRTMLENNGFTARQVDSMNFAQAKATIRKIIDRRERGLCSFKQRKCIERAGINAANMTSKEASKIIERLKANKWKL